MNAGGWFADSDITREVILAECAGNGGYDPGPLAAEYVDEEGEEDDRAGCFDNTVDTSPEGDVGETDGFEDCWTEFWYMLENTFGKFESFFGKSWMLNPA